MTPVRRLRSSSSVRAAPASRTRMAAIESSGASAGSIGAAGLSIAVRAISIASARLNCGVAAAGEAADVEVVDDLVAQVGDVLHERRVGLDVAEHAEAAEHLLAEAVGGGDRRGVEVGERGGEPLAADADLVRRAGGEELHDLVVLPPACPRGRPRR